MRLLSGLITAAAIYGFYRLLRQSEPAVATVASAIVVVPAAATTRARAHAFVIVLAAALARGVLAMETLLHGAAQRARLQLGEPATAFELALPLGHLGVELRRIDALLAGLHEDAVRALPRVRATCTG